MSSLIPFINVCCFTLQTQIVYSIDNWVDKSFPVRVKVVFSYTSCDWACNILWWVCCSSCFVFIIIISSLWVNTWIVWYGGRMNQRWRGNASGKDRLEEGKKQASTSSATSCTFIDFVIFCDMLVYIAAVILTHSSSQLWVRLGFGRTQVRYSMIFIHHHPTIIVELILSGSLNRFLLLSWLKN